MCPDAVGWVGIDEAAPAVAATPSIVGAVAGASSAPDLDFVDAACHLVVLVVSGLSTRFAFADPTVAVFAAAERLALTPTIVVHLGVAAVCVTRSFVVLGIFVSVVAADFVDLSVVVVVEAVFCRAQASAQCLVVDPFFFVVPIATIFCCIQNV